MTRSSLAALLLLLCIASSCVSGRTAKRTDAQPEGAPSLLSYVATASSAEAQRIQALLHQSHQSHPDDSPHITPFSLVGDVFRRAANSLLNPRSFEQHEHPIVAPKDGSSPFDLQLRSFAQVGASVRSTVNRELKPCPNKRPAAREFTPHELARLADPAPAAPPADNGGPAIGVVGFEVDEFESRFHERGATLHVWLNCTLSNNNCTGTGLVEATLRTVGGPVSHTEKVMWVEGLPARQTVVIPLPARHEMSRREPIRVQIEISRVRHSHQASMVRLAPHRRDTASVGLQDAPFCYFGELVQANRTTYTCNGTQVSAAQYAQMTTLPPGVECSAVKQYFGFDGSAPITSQEEQNVSAECSNTTNPNTTAMCAVWPTCVNIEQCSAVQDSKMVCYCPLDHYGYMCEYPTYALCTFQLLDLAGKCGPATASPYLQKLQAAYNWNLDGTPPCISFDPTASSASVRVQTQCRFPTPASEGPTIGFNDLAGYTWPQVNLTYYIKAADNSFAMSTAPNPIKLAANFPDFNRLSSRTYSQGAYFAPVPASSLIPPYAPVSITFPPNTVLPAISKGGRALMQIGFINAGYQSFYWRTLPQVVEVDGYTPPPPPPPTLSSGAIAGIVIACLVVVGGCFGGWWLLRKREERSFYQSLTGRDAQVPKEDVQSGILARHRDQRQVYDENLSRRVGKIVDRQRAPPTMPGDQDEDDDS